MELKKFWDQWPDETDLAYHRFSVYLQLGPERTLDKVVQECNKSASYRSQIGKWSSRYEWVSRCREYDNHVIKESLKNRQEIIDLGRGRLLSKLDEALDVIFEIINLPNYSPSKDLSSNVNQKLKAAIYVLDTAGLVAPDSEVEPAKNANDDEYIRNIYDRIANKYGDEIENN